MARILSLLAAIRRRPGMYIGKPSLIRLGAYLDGYEHAAQDLAGKEPDSTLMDFCDWIHARAGSTRYSWEETILQESKDDADAQERFWKLLDEFLVAHPESVSARAIPGDSTPFSPAVSATSSK